MSPPISSSLVFDQKVREGLFNYKQEDKKVAFVTLSLPWNSDLNLRTCFREMNRRVNKISPMVRIEYIGIIIKQIDNDQNRVRFHAHIFWRKPFVKFEKLKSIWENVIHGENENFAVSTVTITPKSVDRVVWYCHNQKDEHFPCSIEYFYSERWGEIVHRKREPKKPDANTAKKNLRRIMKKYGIGRYKDDT